MQRTGPARDPAGGAVELKLIDLRERVADGRGVGCDMPDQASIECVGGPRNRRGEAAIPLLHLPPGRVVLFRRDLSGEYVPAPFVDGEIARERAGMLIQHPEQERNVRLHSRHALEQAELMEISWGLRRQCDEVAERFVKSFIGASSEQSRLLLVSPEVD